jgi:hypothetical protein
MADVIPLDEFERKAAKQHAHTVASLRTLADQLRAARAAVRVRVGRAV